MILELLTQFSLASIVVVFNIFIVFFIIFYQSIKLKFINKKYYLSLYVDLQVIHKSVVAAKAHNFVSGVFGTYPRFLKG